MVADTGKYELRYFYPTIPKRWLSIIGEIPFSPAYRQPVVSDEMYWICNKPTKLNIKIRDNKLDVKELIATCKGLQQWTPLFKADIDDLDNHRDDTDRLYPFLEYSKDQGLAVPDELIVGGRDFRYDWIDVKKIRWKFMVDVVEGEYAIIESKYGVYHTVSFQHIEASKVLQIAKNTGKGVAFNCSYIDFLSSFMQTKIIDYGNRD